MPSPISRERHFGNETVLPIRVVEKKVDPLTPHKKWLIRRVFRGHIAFQMEFKLAIDPY